MLLCTNTDFWSDASDVGWGAHLAEEVISGRWSPEEASLSISSRELLVVERSSPLSVLGLSVHSSSIRGQFHRSGLSEEGRGHSLGNSEFHSSENSQVGGRYPHCSSPPVYHGEEQCASGCVVQAQSSPRVRMDTQVGGLSGTQQEVAGDCRSVSHLIHSPMFTLFFALPRSKGFGDGCVPSQLGQSFGIRLPTLSTDSAGYQETLLVLRSLDNSDHSLPA